MTTKAPFTFTFTHLENTIGVRNGYRRVLNIKTLRFFEYSVSLTFLFVVKQFFCTLSAVLLISDEIIKTFFFSDRVLQIYRFIKSCPDLPFTVLFLRSYPSSPIGFSLNRFKRGFKVYIQVICKYFKEPKFYYFCFSHLLNRLVILETISIFIFILILIQQITPRNSTWGVICIWTNFTKN